MYFEKRIPVRLLEISDVHKEGDYSSSISITRCAPGGTKLGTGSLHCD